MGVTQDYIRRIDESIEKTRRLESNTDTRHFTLPDAKTHWRGVESMNYAQYLCLINNLCSYPNVSHLHIGCWKGASLFVALDGNPDVKLYGIDDFSIGDEIEGIFWENARRLGYEHSFGFFNGDYRDIELSSMPDKINFHIYDAAHEEEHQYGGIVRFEPVFDNVVIIMIDGFNHLHQETRDGTFRALDHLRSRGWQVCYSKELLEPEWDRWHTGHALFVIEKEN